MKEPDMEDWIKSLQWYNAMIVGHTCEFCGKQIKTPLRVDVHSKLKGYSFHISCARKIVKELGIDSDILKENLMEKIAFCRFCKDVAMKKVVCERHIEYTCPKCNHFYCELINRRKHKTKN